MSLRSIALAFAVAALMIVASAHAGAPLGTDVKKAMLENKPVPVIVTWADKALPKRDLLGTPAVRELLPLHATAAVVPADKLEALAASEAVFSIVLDTEIVLDDPKEQKTEPAIPETEKKNGQTWGLEAIGAKKVWDELGITGKGVRVGVVDTGIDGLHPEFKSRLRRWGDFSFFVQPEPDDQNGHGTHVAGTILGHAHESGPRFGVAPGAELLVGRAIGPRAGLTSQILAAMFWITDPDGNPDTDDGARVINCSFGGPPGSKEQESLWTNGFAHLVNRGVTVVVAAGNAGDNGADTILSPGTIEHSLTVGAVDPKLKRASFSSYSEKKMGNSPGHYPKPDVAAPGADVLSYYVKNTSARLNGTSMATPHVVGVVALMLEANPKLTPHQVREILVATARDLGEPGFDNEFGAGLVDAYAAVKRARELVSNPDSPVKSLEQLISEGQRAMVAGDVYLAVQRFMRVIGTERATGAKAYEAMYYLGEALMRQGHYRGAVASYRKLIELAGNDPHVAKAQFQLGKCYKETPTSDTPQAIASYEKACVEYARFLKTYPDHEWLPTALYDFACCLGALNKREEALALIGQLLTKYSSDPSVANAVTLKGELEKPLQDPLGQ